MSSSLDKLIFLIIGFSGFFVDFDHEFFTVFGLFAELILEDSKIFLQFIGVGLGFIEFSETSAQLLNLTSDFGSLVIQQFAIPLDQFNVIGGSYIIQSFEFLEHSFGHFNDFGMGVSEELSDAFPGFFVKIELFYRVVGYFDQGFGGPRHEPDDGGVVDQARVHSAVVSQVVSGFGHQKDDVEVVLDSGVKLSHENLILDFLYVFVVGIRISHHSGDDFFHFLFDGRQVFLSKEVWNLADCEDGVDILDKGFFSNLVVREHKDS